jgi:hypothetical protein
MTGGLASPPDSRYNSPLFSNGSSLTSPSLHFGQLSSPEFVNPKDLHDSFDSDGEEFGQQESVNVTEQGVGSPSDVELDSTPRSRKSSLPSSLSDTAENNADKPMTATPIKEPSSKSSEDKEEGDSPSSSDSSQNEDGRSDMSDTSGGKSMTATAFQEPPSKSTEDGRTGMSDIGNTSKSSLSEDDEGNDSIVSNSNEPALDSTRVEEKVDETIAVASKTADSVSSDGDDKGERTEMEEKVDEMIVSESEKPGLGSSDVHQEANHTGVEERSGGTIFAQSKRPESESTEDDEDNTGGMEEREDDMIVVESKKPESDPGDNDDEGDQMVGVEFEQPSSPSPDSPVEKRNLMNVDESMGPSDLMKDDEGHLATRVDSTKQSDSLKEKGDPSVGIEEGNHMIGLELSKMSLDSDPSIHLEAAFEPRRSSRNVGKEKPHLKIITSPRSSTGKRKLAVKKDVILLQASVSNTID